MTGSIVPTPCTIRPGFRFHVASLLKHSSNPQTNHGAIVPGQASLVTANELHIEDKIYHSVNARCTMLAVL